MEPQQQQHKQKNNKRTRKGERVRLPNHLTWTLSVWTLPFLQDSPAQRGHKITCLFGHGFPHFWTFVCFMLNKRLSIDRWECERSWVHILSPHLSRSLSVAAPPQLPERLGVEPLLLHVERSQLSWFRHLLRMPPDGGVPGMSNWEETSGQIQNTLEVSYLSAGLGTLWDPPGWAGRMRNPYLACCHREPSRISSG